MNLTEDFKTAETRFIQLLEDFFIRIWGDTGLYSHDINHHRRVWQFACELLSGYCSKDETDNQVSAEELIVACYLHDIGMSIDSGLRHGHLSADLCKSFLNENRLDPGEFRNALQAIENHDNKEYSDPDHGDHLLRILSVADDLDAFGFIGIYRYLEIYLLRGISQQDLGSMISENAARRYSNFVTIFGECPDLIEKHGKRFRILQDFFSGSGQYQEFSNSASRSGSDYSGVIRIVSGMLRDKVSLESLVEALPIDPGDEVTGLFIEGLKGELGGQSMINWI